MNIEDSNLLRNVAKAISKESKEKTKGVKSIAERDVINREIIARHHKPIAAKFTMVQVIYFVGVVRGVMRDPG